MALSTIGTAAIADDAITSAKVDSTTTAFTVADLVVTNGITAGTSINAGSELVGNVSGRVLLDASAAGTDVGEEFLLNATDGSASNDGSKILFEEGTDDPNTVLNSNNTGVAGNINFTGTITGASDLVLLQTVTANDDATVEIGSAQHFTTAYRIYIIYYSNLHLAADNGDINLRLGIGGIVQTGNNYDFCRQVRYDGGTSETGQAGNNQAGFLKAVGQSRGNATGEQSSGYVMVYDPASTDNFKHINIFNTGDDLTPDATMSILGGKFNSGQAALTSVQFYSGAGNLTSGYFRLYGVA